jgi:hypothetical protein
MDLELQPWPSNVSGEGIATKEKHTLVFAVVLNLSFSSCYGEEPGIVTSSSKTVPSFLYTVHFLALVFRSVGSRVFPDVMVNARGEIQIFLTTCSYSRSVASYRRQCQQTVSFNRAALLQNTAGTQLLLAIPTCVLSSSFCRWL